MRIFLALAWSFFLILSLTGLSFAQDGTKVLSLLIDREIHEISVRDCFKQWIQELENEDYVIFYHVLGKESQNLKSYKEIITNDQPDYVIKLGNLKMPEVQLAQRNKKDRSIKEVISVQSYFPLMSLEPFPKEGRDSSKKYFRSASVAIGQINLAYHMSSTPLPKNQLLDQYCAYFEKNLAYRNCERKVKPKASAMVESDFPNMEKSLTTIDPKYVLYQDFSKMIERKSVDMTFVAAHGTSRTLFVTNQGSHKGIHVSELASMPNNSRFWNLYSCNILNNTDQANVGRSLMLTSSPTLGVLGSTKSGAMAYPQFFFKSLSEGQTFGKALLSYLKFMALEYLVLIDQESYFDNNGYHGGLIFNGDPTLKFYGCAEESSI